MPMVNVELGARSYEIIIEMGALAKAGELIASVCRGRNAFVVSEPPVGDLYFDKLRISLGDAGFRVTRADLPGGEQNKTLDWAVSLYDKLLDAGIDRTGILVTLGGGVIGDMGGFAAATYLRGIDFIQIPTTLLAQVDASIGGKVGVDLPRGKNLVGAFYQPKRVIIDPEVLTTLPQRELAGGLAEIVKHGIIASQELFAFVQSESNFLRQADVNALRHAIDCSCRIKAEVVAKDERESGLRAILNYGHTVGHAIEVVTGYGKYTHGEAVAIGMVTAALIAESKAIAPVGLSSEIANVLNSLGLPVAPERNIDMDRVIQSLSYDKKVMFGKLRFVLPVKIGEVIITDTVTNDEVRSSLSEQIRLFG